MDINDHLPWVEKYRPSKLDDLISQGDIVSTINRFIDQDNLPHLLFYGPPGTGKTSTILACAKQLYPKNFASMVLELNASDDRGIEVVREQIKNFASTQMIFKSGYKLIILDEADAMTQPAQAALRRVMEKYSKNVRFCLICNYQHKIIPAIQSRCTRFRFSPLNNDEIRKRLNEIIDAEKLTISDDAVKALIQLSKGDMRKVLNILQSCHAAFDSIEENHIYATTGLPQPNQIERIMNWIMNEDFQVARNNILSLKSDFGLALADIVTEVYKFVLFMDLPPVVLSYLLDQLASVEYQLSLGTSESIQLSHLIGAFKIGIDMIPSQ